MKTSAAQEHNTGNKTVPRTRPFVTLSYAQSLDGCIALSPGCPCPLSSENSLKITHRLRSEHDAILIGIGTALADDPTLTVRHVTGRSPRPVVIDTNLRLPLYCNMIKNNPLPVWIATGQGADKKKVSAFRERNVRIIQVPPRDNGWLDLEALLRKLKNSGINNLMVEGGTGIISSFINEQLVDKVILTICPVYLSGQPSYRKSPGDIRASSLPRLEVTGHFSSGEDIIITGYPIWKRKDLQEKE
ncbi:MAG: GTP cyclohydrolase [Candidatus Omnitrophica bacterium]|nr:GTP cyclohydrolase [Candidatus Omnitrophota bacterium]